MRRSINSTGADFLELSRGILEKGNSVRFQAKGWSMRPLIRDGDFIIVSPVENSSIKTGDVVFYSTAGNKVIVHRLIRKYKQKGRMTVFIKGDASFSTPVKMDIQNVLGKVIAIERNGRKKRVDTKLHQLIGLFLSGISPFSHWIYPIGSSVKKNGRRLLGRYFKESVKS
jgi:signal peptidase I